MTTDILRCSVNELVAIDRAARSHRQAALLRGTVPWGRRDYPFLERLRDVRGLTVIENNSINPIHVTIYGSLTIDGFGKKI